MDRTYYDGVTRMEQLGVDDQYALGWMGGYLGNPEMEEQRITEAYQAGYVDGRAKTEERFENWVTKPT